MASRRVFSLSSTRALLSSPSTYGTGSKLATSRKPCNARSSSSSTSALAYKALHRRSPLPLPVADSPTWSAPAAVSSILYETPVPSTKPPKRHVLNCLVQNEPGVLSRISGILAARGFNIDSLVVCNTEVEDLSRMTIVLRGLDGVVEQARRQLDDLVPVWAVLDYTDSALVQRELLLAKVSILGPEVFEELLQHHREMTTPENEEVSGSAEKPAKSAEIEVQRFKGSQHASDYHPSGLAHSQALRHKHEHLKAITHLTHQFGGKVLDISTNNCIVEVSAKPSRIDSFLKLISPFGILESTRTGLMALPRSPLSGPEEEFEKDTSEAVDASALPPG
ncbi:acetolactate synthase I/III small subunit, variant 2 [Blastomyces dermatitidis ATCC 26199]|nr:acetolactate synthase I/III small subunit [Blastomyces dermatitidis ATCC 26199]EQL32189.1 acetolactate synthase I/III small subunit, variant 1 [Blastomyces dermatitidis ATCC 26199]EQL32190.1 acetolactate synthase I/III small subunit, variant 2 [Blastomyces dermatitidis ATCC 26199]